MRHGHVLLGLMLLTVPLVGCLGNEGVSDDNGAPGTGQGIDHAAIAAAIGEPIELFHDHTDATLHEGSHNLELVSWSTLDVELGVNGFANFVLYEEGDERLALVAIDGDEQGGFTIADVSDPENVEVLGSYRVQGSGFQEVRISPDGNYAVLNAQDIPAPGSTDCSVCIHILDIRDRTDPQLVGVKPVEILGTHNFHFEEIGGELYLLYVGQPLYVGTLPVGQNEPVGNAIKIARFVTTPDGGAQIVDVAEWRLEEALTDEGRSFPHDVVAEPHPLTDQVIMYVSHWDGGAVTVDITDPLTPETLSVHSDPAPSQARATHWFSPETYARGENVYAYSAPEIGQLESGTGVVRAYDVTDPAQLDQVGTWTLPGELNITGQYLLSPHTSIPHPELPLLAVAHYHAGLWILDTSDPADPKHLAYFSPVGDPEDPYTGEFWWKKPNFDPEGFLPNTYQARWDVDRDLLWITDRSTGLYALEYTGPLPAAAS